MWKVGEGTMKEWALYKGEELLSIGTIREIAEEMGLMPTTVEKLRKPSYIKTLKENHKAKILIPLDD